MSRQRVLFIALTGDAKPHFTTISDFNSRSRDAIASVFGQALTLLGKQGLIERNMAAGSGRPSITARVVIPITSA
ncbi:MAG: hypothetical protein ABI082_09005 [Dokdonella sp.]